ncbi:MAG: response regulator [Lachnospiraceae bacterium]
MRKDTEGEENMHVICVDDEKPTLTNFKLTTQEIPQIQSLHLFSTSREALKWAKKNTVDVAFLDIEMPLKNGIELAKELQEIQPDIKIVFATAYEEYALEAFQTKAIRYILKPYDVEEIKEALDLASRIQPKQNQRIVIQTIPEFSISVDNRILYLNGEKPAEMLALLVDRAQAGITTGETIACLWPDRNNDEKTQSLCRGTFHRLMRALKEEHIEYIVRNEGKHKYLNMDLVDCDLYRILNGKSTVLEEKYNGAYLKNYSWAEVRNAQLNQMKKELEK